MKQQGEERVRGFNGSLTHEHMMSMKEMTTGSMFVNREEERARGVDLLFLPSHLYTVDCVR